MWVGQMGMAMTAQLIGYELYCLCIISHMGRIYIYIYMNLHLICVMCLA